MQLRSLSKAVNGGGVQDVQALAARWYTTPTDRQGSWDRTQRMRRDLGPDPTDLDSKTYRYVDRSTGAVVIEPSF
jgi:hypothetical protein